MSDSLEDKLKAVSEEIGDLEELVEGKREAQRLELYANFSIVPAARETHKARVEAFEALESKTLTQDSMS